MATLIEQTRRTAIGGTQQSHVGSTGGSTGTSLGVQSGSPLQQGVTYGGPTNFNYIGSFFSSYPRDVPSGTGARAGTTWNSVQPVSSLGGTPGDPYGDYNFASQWGMQGSRVISGLRQAQRQGITHFGDIISTKFGGSEGEGIQGGTVNASVDWSLGERKNTVGTPEFFRAQHRGYKAFVNSGGDQSFLSKDFAGADQSLSHWAQFRDPLGPNLLPGERYLGRGDGSFSSGWRGTGGSRAGSLAAYGSQKDAIRVHNKDVRRLMGNVSANAARFASTALVPEGRNPWFPSTGGGVRTNIPMQTGGRITSSGTDLRYSLNSQSGLSVSGTTGGPSRSHWQFAGKNWDYGTGGKGLGGTPIRTQWGTGGKGLR